MRTALQAEPKAYSYIRFSTPEQAKGHSLQRQTEAAQAWVAANGVMLDDELTFQDRGVSGYTGANLETGALGVFLECVRDGTIPRGSWLLVENLDRISRQVARKAVRTVEDIVEAGVTVVDLSDGWPGVQRGNARYGPDAVYDEVIRFIRSMRKAPRKACAWRRLTLPDARSSRAKRS